MNEPRSTTSVQMNLPVHRIPPELVSSTVTLNDASRETAQFLMPVQRKNLA